MQSNTNSKFKRLLQKLKGVRETGTDQCEALCPAHDDRRPSLAVSLGEKGNILVHCHAGCKTPDVLKLLGMKMSDLAAPKPSRISDLAVGKRKIIASYDYCDDDGKLLFQVVRSNPKGFWQRRRMPGGRWENSATGCKVVPYRLPELLKAKSGSTVWVVEGEKDVERLRELGFIATCNAMGADKWRAEHAEYLAGHHVIILPDNDETGRKHAEQVARSLVSKASSIKILSLPDLAEKGDISDWLDAGGNKKELLRLAKKAAEWQPSDEEGEASTANEETKPLSQATQLIAIAERAEVFHDSRDEAYARFPVGGHYEVAAARSRSFRNWLAMEFFAACGRPPATQAAQEAMGVIEGKARYTGGTRNTCVRVAEHDGKLYLDLADDEWRVVEIDAKGWRVIRNSPVMFRRPKAALPLPEPSLGGRLELLRRFVNVSNNDWPLILAWLIATLRPSGPFPILALNGLKGSAKSTTCKVLRALVDPKTPAVRSFPRSEHDLIIAADNSLVTALDNLSELSPWQSDCLCRLATGGGFTTRMLYQNEEEVIFDTQRPVILNGITEPVTRSDLLDRSLLISLPPIEENGRKTEADLCREFELARPQILGALLSAVSAAMRRISSIKLSKLPRMADFIKWAIAAEEGLGLQGGTILRSYTRNLDSHHELAIESSLVGKAVLDFVRSKGKWCGTATQLCAQVRSRLPPTWRGTAKTVSDDIRHVQQNLNALGVNVVFQRVGQNRTRQIQLSLQPKKASTTPSASSAPKAKPKQRSTARVLTPTPKPAGKRSSLSSTQRGGGRSGRNGRKNIKSFFKDLKL